MENYGTQCLELVLFEKSKVRESVSKKGSIGFTDPHGTRLMSVALKRAAFFWAETREVAGVARSLLSAYGANRFRNIGVLVRRYVC